jgi:hypothetical protein
VDVDVLWSMEDLVNAIDERSVKTDMGDKLVG